MDGRIMRTLDEYITELHSGNRNSDRTNKQSGFNTTLNNDTDSEQGHWDGDERHRTDSPG